MAPQRFLTCDKIHRLLILMVFLFGAAASGCVTAEYEAGVTTDPAASATIRVEQRPSGKGKLQIVRIDGKLTAGFLFGARDVKFVEEAKLLPGKHRILTRIDMASSYAHDFSWLVAEPGETYIVKARSEGYHVTFWIENERTGQTVGGRVGSDDEPKDQEPT